MGKDPLIAGRRRRYFFGSGSPVLPAPVGTSVAFWHRWLIGRLEAFMLTSTYRLDRVTDLAALMRAEYGEMPGLVLTARQAVRLWTAEPVACAQALESLVRSGFLRRVGTTYMRADCGRRSA